MYICISTFDTRHRFAEKGLEDTKLGLQKVGITTFFLLRKFLWSQNLIYSVPFLSIESAVNAVSPEIDAARRWTGAAETMIVLRAFHKDLWQNRRRLMFGRLSTST